jgi:dTDP-4-dehydrorhamnose reductase
MARVLIVGAGYVGRGIAAAVRQAGDQPVLACRQPRDGGGTLTLDARDPHACAQAVAQVQPDAVVAVHGPSDVTWCQAHPDQTMRAHEEAARAIVKAAAGARLLLISTDNVFDGVADSFDEDAPPAPANAYGQAKLAAEQVVQTHPDATVLRVSLVYGPPSAVAGVRANFAADCVARLRAGQPVRVPDPQWTTPVHVADVGAVAVAALRDGPGLLHLGGPDRISRLDWAHLLARRYQASPHLISAVSKADSDYACRPTNSCLTSRLLPDLLTTWGLRLRAVDRVNPLGED